MSGTSKTWATPLPGAIALVGVGVALAVASAASYQDPAATIVIGLAAFGVLVWGVFALVRRPRLELAAGPRLRIKSVRGAWELAVDDVKSIEVLDTRRLMFHSKQILLESTEGRLAVFTRWDLGEDPGTVAHILWDAGFPQR